MAADLTVFSESDIAVLRSLIQRFNRTRQNTPLRTDETGLLDTPDVFVYKPSTFISGHDADGDLRSIYVDLYRLNQSSATQAEHVSEDGHQVRLFNPMSVLIPGGGYRLGARTRSGVCVDITGARELTLYELTSDATTPSGNSPASATAVPVGYNSDLGMYVASGTEKTMLFPAGARDAQGTGIGYVALDAKSGSRWWGRDMSELAGYVECVNYVPPELEDINVVVSLRLSDMDYQYQLSTIKAKVVEEGGTSEESWTTWTTGVACSEG